MTVGRGKVRRAGWQRRREFVSDIFHTISQPLTAVHVSLELALKKRDAAEQRLAIREALAVTAKAVDMARFIRLLADAEDPGEIARVELDGVLRRLVSEMNPVAQACGAEIAYSGCGPVWVQADDARLAQALFLIADVGVRGGERCGLLVTMQMRARRATITFGAPDCDATARKCGCAFVRAEQEERAVSLARTMIGAIGGRVEHWRKADKDWWLVSIPRIAAPE